MMKTVISGIVFVVILVQGVRAQKGIADTVLSLPPVSVEGSRVDAFSTGMRIRRIDTAVYRMMPGASVAELLTEYSSLFVKSYGPGNIATLSFRGTGPAHTAVIWNGFNLQNPMNGGTDLSLISSRPDNRIGIQSGSAGALSGSGAIGGAIHVDVQPAFGSGFRCYAGASLASFGGQFYETAITLGAKNLYAGLSYFRKMAENDFSFVNTARFGMPRMKQPHAAVSSQGGAASLSWIVSHHIKTDLNVELSQADRDVPPSMTQTISEAWQGDENLRSSTAIHYYGNKVSLTIRSAFLFDRYHYIDPRKEIDSRSSSESSITEAEGRFRIAKRHLISAGVGMNFTKGITDYYDGEIRDDRPSLFASYLYRSKNDQLHITASVRSEYYQRSFINPVPSAGAELKLPLNLIVFGNLSGSYRIPTLNDRFWIPGGNPDLKPEQGWSAELGLKHRFLFRKGNSDVSISGYTMDIQNWIAWQPGLGFWSPKNISRVWSRGMEASASAEYKSGNWIARFGGDYALVYACETNRSYECLGPQLAYVPRHKAAVFISANYRKYYLTISANYTGNRLTSAAALDAPLKGFTIGAIRFSKDFEIKNLSFTFYASVQNLWNTTYQLLEYYATPGTNFNAGIRVGFIKPIKKQIRS